MVANRILSILKRKETFLSLMMLALIAFFVSWQISDHMRMREDQNKIIALLKRDLGNAIAGILNSQPRFGSIVVQSYVAEKLNALIGPGRESPLRGIAFLNRRNELLMEVDSGLPEAWYSPDAKPTRDIVMLSQGYVEIASAAGFEGNLPVLGDQQTIMAVINLLSASTGGLPPGGQQITDEVRALLSDEFLAGKSVSNIVFAFDVGFLHRTIAKDLVLRVFSILFCLLAFAVFVVSLFSLGRSARLSALLAIEKDKNEHSRELHLLAAGLAHEIKNPLNLLRCVAQSIVEIDATPEEIRNKVSTMTEEVDRITGRLDSFLAYSRVPASSPSRIDCRRIVEDVLDLLASDISGKKLRVTNDVEETRAWADEDALRQIVFNLLHNAVKATGESGSVRISSGITGDWWLEVSDDGPGVPEEFREDIFKPYFSIGSSGTGLGLAIARHIATANNWRLRYVDNPGAGAKFRLEGIKRI